MYSLEAISIELHTAQIHCPNLRKVMQTFIPAFKCANNTGFPVLLYVILINILLSLAQEISQSLRFLLCIIFKPVSI